MSDIEKFNGNSERLALLTRTICKGASPDELELFSAICDRTGLDPFSRQIFAVKRWDSREKREVMQPQVSIDGFRLVAQRSREYQGQTAPVWYDENGKASELWIGSHPPFAARVGVWREGFREPCVATALWSEYCQKTKDGSPTGMWSRMPALMLAKCAEALALRKAFPAELSGLYTSDEMAQATTPEIKAVDTPARAPRTKSAPIALPMIEAVSEAPAPIVVADKLSVFDSTPKKDTQLMVIYSDALGNQVGKYWRVTLADGSIAAADEALVPILEANARFGTAVVGNVRRYAGGKSLLLEIVRNATDAEVSRGTI